MVTCSCLGFLSAVVQSRHPWREVCQQAHLRRPSAWYCLSCLSKNWYFEVGEMYICGHLCVTSLLLCICSPNPWVLFSGMVVSCYSRAIGVFSCQALHRSEFLLIVSSTSCCWTEYVVLNSNSNHCLFSELPSASTRVRHTELRHSSSIRVWSAKV